MKKTIAVIALLTSSLFAQDPTPTPAPLTVQLSGSTTIGVVQVVQQSVTSIKIDWILIEPDKAKITVKVQPFNKEFYISGDDYAAVRDALRPGLEQNLLPLVMPQVNSYAAALRQQTNGQ